MMTDIAVYIHVPYCTRPCYYCAFDRVCSLKTLDAWEKRIRREIEEDLKTRGDFLIPSLYFGGGTPSILDDEFLEELVNLFKGRLKENAEITLEANPEDLDLNRLKRLHTMGFNRLSLGVQSFDDALLKRIGRRHTENQAVDVFNWAREAGFNNISLDLMYGFPFETGKVLEKDLEMIEKLQPEHVSAYSWIKEENSVFGKKNLPELDEDESADEYELVRDRLIQAGYVHYEISSFMKDNHFSRHNLLYWQDGHYLGYGYGACGHDEKGFYHHSGSLNDYVHFNDEIVYDQDLDDPFTLIMTGLRSVFGISIDDFQKKSGLDLMEISKPVFMKYPGRLEIRQGFLCPTESGMEILNEILMDYMDCF